MGQGFWGKVLRKGCTNAVAELVFPPDVLNLDPKPLLKAAKKCVECVWRMISTSLQFNFAQCVHLACKLKVAAHCVENLAWPADYFNSQERRPYFFKIEVLKLLLRSANEVESFIQGCRKEKWIQAAIVFGNTTEYVSQLSFNLELCAEVCESELSMQFESDEEAWRAVTALESKVRTKFKPVKERVAHHHSGDRHTLLTKLENVLNPSIKLTEQESQLAKSLLSRLTQRLESGSVQLSCWEIQYSSLKSTQKLGAGAFGEVLKSSWLGLDVAAKMFIGPDPPTFKDEVKSMAVLEHPNIVPLIGYAMDKNKCCIVMELMDGDLPSLMRERERERSGPFSIFEAVDLMLQSAEGMHYLHQNRLVHRDLKAQNILVKRRKDIYGESVYAKVADFGLSRTKESSTCPNLTLNIGSTRWMAPELMPLSEGNMLMRTANDPQLRHPFKVDMYSFGMLCYEILTGEVPFSSISDLREVRKMVLKGDRPELPDDCPQSLKTLIHSCWDAEASHRPRFVEICTQLRCLKYLLMTAI